MNFLFSPMRRHGLGASLAACILFFAVVPVCAGVVEGVRFSASPERTRVVLDMDSATSYEHRTLTNPHRVLVAMEQSSFARGVVPTKLDKGVVNRIRLNTLSSGRIQVVLDLNQAATYSTFTLANPPRIVVDVVPTEGANVVPETPAPVASKKSVVTPVEEPRKRGPWLVAIDAGHGGDDPGCQYHGLREKEIVLALGREVQAAVNRMPGFEAFMVRKGDYLVPLTTRRQIAGKRSADMFVSIHCNASENPESRGTEVFFLSLKGASDQAAHDLALRENAADEALGLDVPEGDLEEIVFDMVQTDVLAKSERLAESCLDALVDLGTVYNRGVKQAGFVVLKSPSIPSILVEAAFLSNREEAKLLADTGWQREFGRLMAKGIKAYCQTTQSASVPAVR